MRYTENDPDRILLLLLFLLVMFLVFSITGGVGSEAVIECSHDMSYSCDSVAIGGSS